MRRCPNCDAAYDEAVDAVCAHCGVDLPAPYEGWGTDEDDDDGEVVNPLPVPGMAAEVLRRLDIGQATPRFTPAGTLEPDEITILSGATVIIDDEEFTPGTLVLAGGRIVDVLHTTLPDPRDGTHFYHLPGLTITPGYIDVHLHGMMGINTNSAEVDDLLRFSQEAAEHGLTSIVPTTLACPPAELRRVLSNLREARKRGTPGARLLGAHLESNFISPDFKGAQPRACIFAPDDPQGEDVRRILEEYADEVRIVTLAPEVPGALELIPWLLDHDIIVSLGHSGATYEQAIAAIDAGATHATHLFNAMAPLHHRTPGLVGAALERDEVFTEVVCDGVHVHPAVVSMVISAKGAERCMPVSDSLQAAGMTEGDFDFGGQHVTVRDGVARLDSGTIAGSITTMAQIVRFLVTQVGWNLNEALQMASATPAEGLGIGVLGRMAQGAVADLVVLDADLQVRMTFVAGRLVFQQA